MSFTLFLFHLLVLVLISPRFYWSSVIHDGFWALKFMLIIAIYIGVFFIPHPFYVVWAHICRAGSLVFFGLQAYFLFNASYTLNDLLLS